MAVQRSKLQLVGTACMFIAAKYEEIYPPDVSEFVYITDDTYNKRQVPLPTYLYLLVIRYR
jgi:cyclin A